MENPFFSDRRWFQQPDPTRHYFCHSPAFRGAPVYQANPAQETHQPGNPIHRPPERKQGPRVVQIPVHFVESERLDRSGSALKIQKVFRGFLVRKYLRKIREIKVQVDQIEERLLKSDVVELVRRNERERLKLSESLMNLLFKLDSVSGLDFGVRGCRKAVIRKAIALQERLDSIVAVGLEANREIVDRDTEIGVSDCPNPEIVDQDTEIGVSPETDDLEKSNRSFADAGNLGDVCGGDGDKTMDVEGNGEDVDVIDVGVDREVKVSESNSVGENLEESVKASSNDGDEKLIEVKEKNGEDKDWVVVDRMGEDNEKMMKLMMQLLEKNEAQTRMLNALTHRVELLEKAFVCDKLRRKKKKTTKMTTTKNADKPAYLI